MLVLESGPHNTTNSSPTSMLTPGAGSQYIQPDYLSPLPTTLDAKRSPLALLAQTCSQIGADPLPPAAKNDTKSRKDQSVGSSSSADLSSGKCSKTPPVSTAGSAANGSGTNTNKNTPPDHRREENGAREESHKSGFKSPGVTSNSTSKSATNHSAASLVNVTTTSAPDALKLADARSGLDVLQGLPKDVPLGTYRPAAHAGFPTLAASSYPALDAATAAALNLGFRHPYPHLGLAGYPSLNLTYPPLNYGRLPSTKSDSVCRDPYCTGCPSSVLPAVSTSSASCPAGCGQCDHPKSSTATTPTSSATSASPTGSSSSNKPYVCNWIAGDHYCGKRFSSSEELLQHLRSHTSLTVASSAETSSTATYTSPLLNPALHPHSLFAQSSLHRSAYPTPPLSPLSMARYHPYSKPSSMTGPGSSPLSIPSPSANPLLSMSPNLAALGVTAGSMASPLASLGGLGPVGSHNPLSLSPYAAAAAAAAAAAGHPALGAYYSHPAYSLYSQRLGPGVLP